MMKLQQIMTEASEISIEELSPKERKMIEDFVKIFNIKSTRVWSGIHGKIVDLEPRGLLPSAYRFTTDMLRKVIKYDIRWIEGGEDKISIGF